MPYACPTCREEHPRLWVVEDLADPFGCTGCIRKRGVEAIEVPIAAREAWPQVAKEERALRIRLALSEAGKGPSAGDHMSSAAASVALVEAAARLLGRGRRTPLAES